MAERDVPTGADDKDPDPGTDDPGAARVTVFDTTLRDGEQSPGIALDPDQKLTIARSLARLRVDVIEAGFPVASQGDFEAVSLIASEVRGPRIAALCRTQLRDIDRAFEAIEAAGDAARLHVFIATSELHMRTKLRMTPEQVLGELAAGVAHARALCADVEFSPEDGYRSDRDFLLRACRTAVDAGATTINLPDTVGFATPEHYGELVAFLVAHLDDDVVVSTHCHDDLGLAVANTLAGVRAGARQVEVAVNGIGERAGNAALEEVVVALATRADHYRATTGVDTRQLTAASRLVSHLTGYPVQFNKAVVGRNAFAHESGIHQHGVLADRRNYEVIDAASVGQAPAQLVLGKHSGRHAFSEALATLGHHLVGPGLDEAFTRFKELADTRPEVTAADLDAIARDAGAALPADRRAVLCSLRFTGGASAEATAEVRVRPDAEPVSHTATGTGAVDAACRAVAAAFDCPHHLVEYRVEAVTGGLDALARVFIELVDDTEPHGGTGADHDTAPRHAGRRAGGHASAPDVVEASARAYLEALERLARRR